MGWLFKKKKVIPKVPFPETIPSSYGTLRFPEKLKERIIEPEDIQSAAGLTEESSEPAGQDLDLDENNRNIGAQEELPPLPEAPAVITRSEPLYVKKDVYQRILGEIGNLKDDLLGLSETNGVLENSEYNEESNFEKLRKAMKNIHDRLLQVDKVLFKS